MLVFFFILFLIIGVPIGVATGLSAVIPMLSENLSLVSAAQKMYAGVDSFSLMAIPFFIFAGDIMLKGGASKRLINFANQIFGWITGGLPITAVISSMFFAALSGSSPATVAGIGGVMIPELFEKKYNKKFTLGLLCAAGSLGIVIPPSITFMTYGVTSEQSISSLFIAGILPGLFIGLTLIIYSYIYAKKHKYKTEPVPNLREIFLAFKETFFSILMPIIILGGIYMGIATPTEAAAVSIIYSIIISVFVYKEIDFKDILEISKKSVLTSAMIMFVIACSNIFSWYLTFKQIPQMVANSVLSISDSPIVLMLIINLILLFVGMIMDSSAAVIILTPLLLPIVTSVGINPIHFGVIMIVNLSIGMLTPPFGLNIYVATGISKMPLSYVIKGCLPFLVLLFFDLMVITVFPQLSLFLL